MPKITPFDDEKYKEWFISRPMKPVGAGMVCYDDVSNKALVVKSSYKDHWSLPGGVCDENESPKAAAIRETKEEVGVFVPAEEASFAGVEYGFIKRAQHDRFYFVFAAPISQETELTLQFDEIDEVRWVDSDELRRLSNNRGSLRIAADWLDHKTVQYLDDGL